MRKTFLFVLSLLICAVLCTAAVFAAEQTVYVKDGGTGDGKSAATPLGTLNAAVSALGGKGGTAAVKVLGTVGNNDDRDEGYVAEIAIPKALVGLSGAKRFKVRPALVNVDDSGSIGDTLTGVSAFSTKLWPEIILD